MRTGAHIGLFVVVIAACSAPAPSAEPPATGPPPAASPSDATLPDGPRAAATTTASAAAPNPDGSAAATDPPKPKGPPPPLPKGTTVLHVGDSMADALGKSLRRELQQRGIKNILKAKESTYIPEWAGFKWNFAGLLASHEPDLVIITLGGNEVAMPDPTIRAAPVRSMIKQVGDRPCIWIAAPLWPGAPHSGILEVIRDNCAPCRYVDTNVLIPDLKRLGDKVHPTIPERRRWAKYMIRWLRHNRDPNGARPWQLKDKLEPPPPESESWE